MPTQLTKEELNALAGSIVDKLIQSLSDEATADKISNVWGKYLDRMLGRGLRRLLGVVIVFLFGVAAIKFDLLAQIFFGKH